MVSTSFKVLVAFLCTVVLRLVSLVVGVRKERLVVMTKAALDWVRLGLFDHMHLRLGVTTVRVQCGDHEFI